MKDRIEFKYGVRDTLFKRANGKCSVPRCTRPTAGPYKESEEAQNMGVACHIYSAADNGPRGRGGKSEEFLSSAENGIWCCSYHADLIDKKKGLDYPATDLFAWKALAEARTRKLMNDIPSPLGWVDVIEFTEFPVKELLPKASLSRRTLLWSEGERGKTSILEAAASVTNSRYAERFIGRRFGNNETSEEVRSFKAKVIYSTVDSFSKEVKMEIAGGKMLRYENELRCLLPPGDVEIIYCSPNDCRKLEKEDDVDFLMRLLNVDRVTLYALIDRGTTDLMPGLLEIRHAEDYVDDETDKKEHLYKENDEPYLELHFNKKEHGFWLPFEELSGSEKDRLMLDLLIRKAREVSSQRLTLLLVENLVSSLDLSNFERLLNCLGKEDFQVVIVTPPCREIDLIQRRNGEASLKPLEFLKHWRLCDVGQQR